MDDRGQPVSAAEPAVTARRPAGTVVRPPRLWMWLSSVAASVAAAGSVVGLLAPDRIYGGETVALADAATAQDMVMLTLVAPLLIVLGVRASRGSLPACLGWLGCLAFTAYNYAIYAFSIRFGPLFLPWVAVLGLSTFALAGGLSTVDIAAVRRRFAGRAMTAVGRLLIVVAAAFVLLWLSEIVPDLSAGNPSRSADAWRVPTNPVHVLDLAFFLPAIAATGILVLRGRPLGYATAPGQLVFLALTCLPILVTPVVAGVRGHEAGWAVVAPVGVVLAASLVALWRTLRTTPPSGGPATSSPTAEPTPARAG
jgi:hypothetical protein